MIQIANLIQKYISDLNSEHWKACSKVILESTNCFECFRKQFFDDNLISYDCDQKRKLYVLRFLPVHQMEVYLALSRIPEGITASIARQKSIRVLSIGSGPGSDILAFRRIIANGLLALNGITGISVKMVDKEPRWDNILHEVLQLYGSGLNYSYKKSYFDFGDKQIIFNDVFDYLLLSYVVSEFSDEQLDNSAEKLRNCVGNPSVLIINDINEKSVVEKINRFVSTFKVQQNIIQFKNRVWCEVSYPDEIKEAIKPKLKTNSIQYTLVVSP